MENVFEMPVPASDAEEAATEVLFAVGDLVRVVESDPSGNFGKAGAVEDVPLVSSYIGVRFSTSEFPVKIHRSALKKVGEHEFEEGDQVWIADNAHSHYGQIGFVRIIGEVDLLLWIDFSDGITDCFSSEKLCHYYGQPLPVPDADKGQFSTYEEEGRPIRTVIVKKEHVFSDGENLEMGKELSEYEQEKIRLEGEKKTSNASFTTRINAKQEHIKELAGKIQAGCETRSYTCRTEYDRLAGIKRLIDIHTEEVIAEEVMSPDEYTLFD